MGKLSVKSSAVLLGAKQDRFDQYMQREGVRRSLGTLQLTRTHSNQNLMLKWWRFPTAEEKGWGGKSTFPYTISLRTAFGVETGDYMSTEITPVKLVHTWEHASITFSAARAMLILRTDSLGVALVCTYEDLTPESNPPGDYDPWKRVKVKSG